MSINENNIIMIETSKLNAHPQNPRKDLGDLSELADSIKANGIFQNLTVVPWFSAITLQPADNNKMDDEYRVVIGHRRLEAAKLAGVTSVPCILATMDYKTQLSTMLLENMQRSDLTVLEQAEGFQMMLDFGETVETIATQTGFSQSTVRRRTKLLELDRDQFRTSVERGGTLEDFAKLDQLANPERKNEVLAKIGTNNFDYALKSAIAEERHEVLRDGIVTQLEVFAKRTEDKQNNMLSSDGWDYYNQSEVPTIEVPEDIGETEYLYMVYNYGVTLYRKGDEAYVSAKREETEDERQKREARTAREEITARAFELRENFVQNYSGPKKNNPIVIEMLLRGFLEDSYFSANRIYDLLKVDFSKNEEDADRAFEIVYAEFAKNQEKGTLAMAYCIFGDNINESYFEWTGKHSINENLNLIYSYLERLGYLMSDEEKTLQGGTHKLFVPPEPVEDEV